MVHILDPSRDVEGNYHSYSVVLSDGRVLSGMLAGESATSIELIDAEAQRRQILREDIDELNRSGKSVMPEGFEKLVSREEFSDLLGIPHRTNAVCAARFSAGGNELERGQHVPNRGFAG